MPVAPTGPEVSDPELVSRAAAGDKEAFGALFERYRHVVYRFARAMTGLSHAAEDVTQEVFVILIRELPRYEPGRASLSTYLYGIARNLSRDRARRERRFFSLDALGPAPASSREAGDPFARIEDAQVGVAVREALVRLPMRYREAVILCDLHDLSYAETAAVLKTSVGAVRSRLHRGRHMLRRRLQRFGAGGARHAARSVRCSA
ncbi:MAG: RNA polymerase sigma factor, partial [Acidobacteria bacterium]|nr:RNA polymerase sigma factor [Acidobacteriota bacterium]